MAPLDPTTTAFIAHLHRGGQYGYYWISSEAKDEETKQPKYKRTQWWQINGHIPDLPPARNGYGDLHLYFGINPVSEIPSERRNREGETYRPRPEKVRPLVREIAAINCLFAEFDFKSWDGSIEALEPPPSVVVRSGGGYHCYWLLAHPYLLDTEERRQRAKEALADFVTRVNGDPASKDLSRVLRVPGSINYKAAYGPNYPRVEYVVRDLDQLYTLDELAPARPPRAATTFAWDRTAGGSEVDKAAAALARLSRWRVDDYEAWVKVGMALRDLGADGLRLWDDWSRSGKTYSPRAVEAKWYSLIADRPSGGITLGSLFAWAKEDDPGGEPSKIRPLERRVRAMPRAEAAPVDDNEWLTIEQARTLIRHEIEAYLAAPPTYMLVIAAPAGLGKSHLAVLVAEAQARAGKRVVYCGPRRDFFTDIVATSRGINGPTSNPLDLWYAWEARTTERSDGTTPCMYPDAMTKWLAKGHGAIKLCASGLCGWRYVSGKDACAYHQQKTTQAPIIFAQHAHAVLGHPLMETAHLLIGDEIPLDAFTHRWRIPRRAIVPSWAPPDDGLTTLLDTLRQLSQRVESGDVERPISGADLLNELGGAASVVATLANPNILDRTPYVRHSSDVDKADYNHVPTLISLLRAEAEETVAGRACIERVVVNADGLMLYRGYQPNDGLPPHVIWLDATANEHVYKELFWPRPVRLVAPKVKLRGRVNVVTDRSWGKTQLVNADGEMVEEGGTLVAQQLTQTIDRIMQLRQYKKPALITYKDTGNSLFGDMTRLHFYGNRGSNALIDCDVLFVIGTPMIARHDLDLMGRMVFKRRLRPFDTGWGQVWRPYEGQGDLGYDVTVIADPDLRALHWQLTEAELIQSIHRARPLLRPVDIWLLSNRPLDGVPVAELWSIRRIFGAVDANGDDLPVEPWRWPEVVRVAEACEAERGAVLKQDLMDRLGLPATTAANYLEAIGSMAGWELTQAATKQRGRPPKAAHRLLTKSD